MLWVKFGSVLIIILVVILATLGGKEFFQYFDVSIHKKEANIVQKIPSSRTADDKHEEKHIDDSSNRAEGDKKRSEEWSEFN
jgi:hypothetical protein